MRKISNDKVTPPPMKRESFIPTGRIQLSLRSRFNPIRFLTPELLSFYLDRFKVGYIRDIALAWDSIEERDDKIKTVKPLRDKAASRLKWQIMLNENLDDSQKALAEKHKEALEYFYQNLTVTSAIDENIRGRVPMLIRQMMDAVGKKYSVHEIVWIPKDGKLTAQFRWTPLWFFENTTGKLRYLALDGEAFGTDLDEGGWMVTVGEGLMVATCIAWMFKSLPLRDWVTFCERNGMPAFLGKTNAQVGTPQYEAMVSAVMQLSNDFAAVMNMSDTIDVLDLKGDKANAPYEPLIERMDKAIAALWRGGDLSTMSSRAGHATGTLAQGEEADNIIGDDAEMITETLNSYVTNYVIQYTFGDDTPLAHFQLQVEPQEDINLQIDIDTFLVSYGAPIAIKDAMARYGRSLPDAGDELLKAPATPSPQALNQASPKGTQNTRRLKNDSQNDEDQLLSRAKAVLSTQLAQKLKPLRKAIQNALQGDDAGLSDRLQDVVKAVPSMLKQLNLDTKVVATLQNTLSAAFFTGLTENPEK